MFAFAQPFGGGRHARVIILGLASANPSTHAVPAGPARPARAMSKNTGSF
jgi:hypothetical protein